MITYVYKKCAWILSKKPLMLWGLSLLCGLLTKLAAVFGVLPIISLPITFTLEAGMVMIYIDGYNGKTVNSDQLFKGFKNFAHVAGGMAWKALWQMIWGLVCLVSVLVIMTAGFGTAASMFLNRVRTSYSMFNGYDTYSRYSGAGTSILIIVICFFMMLLFIAGIVLVVVKSYAYRFTPYILMNKPEISATEALRLSMRQTKGHKGALFLADLICWLALFLATTVFLLFSSIPYVGGFFAVVLGIVMIIILLLCPLFMGLVRAGLYIEITNSTEQAQGGFNGNPQPNGPAAQRSDSNASFMNGAAPTPAEPQYNTTPAEPQYNTTPAEPQHNTNPAGDAIFCTGCGNPMRQEQKFCPKCGKPRQ